MVERGLFFDLESIREKEKPREVVRVCVTRSRRSNEFDYIFKNKKIDFGDLIDIDFVSFMMAEKGPESHNPGQVMPVGGKIEEGESVEQAAIRELGEETHLRPVSEISRIGKIRYQIPDRQTKVDATYVGTKILPTDYPYSINPDDDKIRNFHYFTLGRFNDLLIQGKSSGKKSDVELLDSLQVPYAEEESPDEEKVKLNLALSEYLQGQEKTKKIDVILRWFDTSSEMFLKFELKHKLEEWKKELQGKGADIYTIQRIWRDVISELSEKGADVEEVKSTLFRAVDLSNFSECVTEGEDGQFNFRSELEGGLYLVYALLETYGVDDEYLKITKQNSKLKSLAEKIEKFILRISARRGNNVKEKLKSFSTFLDYAETEEGVDVRLEIEQIFCDVFGIKIEDLAKKLNSVDDFFDGLTNDAILSTVGKNGRSNKLQQNNEIRGADLITLLQKALPIEDVGWKKRYKIDGRDGDKTLLKSLVFEARRKLALLILLSPAEDDYLRRQNEYSVVFETLFRKISGPNYEFEVSPEDEYSIPHRVEKQEDEDVDFSVEQPLDRPYYFLRRMPENGNHPAYFIDIDKPVPKSKGSFLCKMVIRSIDDPKKITDYHRRSILFADVDVAGMGETEAAKAKERLYKRETRKIPNVYAGDSSGESLEEVTDVVAILDLMEDLVSKEGVKLTHFKPTPLIGERIKSEGGGGGGDVRFSKFYIEKTTFNGTVAHEEQQIYTPGEDGHPSAFYFKEQKNLDDANYYFRRLLRTKGRHSATDLFFPAGIYGKPILEAKKKMEQKAE